MTLRTVRSGGARGVLVNVGVSIAAICTALFVAEILAGFFGLGVKFGRFLPIYNVPTRVVDGNVLWEDRRPRHEAGDIDHANDDPTAFLILGLGDSIMYGVGQPKEVTYLEEARRLLTARSGRTVKVLNLAVPGYNTKQEAAVFKELEGRVRPNVVIVHYWGDDVRQYRQVGGYIVDIGDMSEDGRLIVRALPLPPRLSDFLLVHSRLYGLLTELAIKYTRVPEPYNWQRVSEPMVSINERAKRAGGRLLVLASADLSGPTPVSTSDIGTLKKLGVQQGFEVIDVADWLQGVDPRTIAMDGCHFNAAGHHLLAERLAEYFLTHDLKSANQ